MDVAKACLGLPQSAPVRCAVVFVLYLPNVTQNASVPKGLLDELSLHHQVYPNDSNVCRSTRHVFRVKNSLQLTNSSSSRWSRVVVVSVMLKIYAVTFSNTFRVDGQVVCLESGCEGTVIRLTPRLALSDGGLSAGFGSLSRYRVSTPYSCRSRPHIHLSPSFILRNIPLISRIATCISKLKTSERNPRSLAE